MGPTPQRMAQNFADALASRVAGDGIVRYAAELPIDKEVREYARVYVCMQFVKC